jgi:hypothetical protein
MLDTLAAQVEKESWAKVVDIPEGNKRKSRPFIKRTKVTQAFQMKAILDIVKRTYGLDLPRLSLLER